MLANDGALDAAHTYIEIFLAATAVVGTLYAFSRWIIRKVIEARENDETLELLHEGQVDLKRIVKQTQKDLELHMDDEIELRKEEYRRIEALINRIDSMVKGNAEDHVAIVSALMQNFHKPSWIHCVDIKNDYEIHFQWGNDAFWELYDIHADEMDDAYMWLIVDPNDRDRVAEVAMEKFKEKASFTIEYNMVDPTDGRLRYKVRNHAHPFSRTNGTFFNVGTIDVLEVYDP